MRLPLSAKLIVYFLFLSTLSIFIVGKFSYLKTKEALINRTFDQLVSIRIEKEKRLQDLFNQCENDLNIITELDDSKNILENLVLIKNNYPKKQNSLSKYILGYLRASNRYENIIFIDTSKNVFEFKIKKDYEYKPKSFVFYSNDYNLITKNKELTVFEAVTGNKHTIDIGKSVYSNKNELLGIVIIEISYQAIDEIIFENNIYNGLGKTGEVYLVGTDGLMRSSSRFIKNSKFLTKVNSEGFQEALKNVSGQKIIKDYRNLEVFSSYKKITIAGLTWIILAEIDKSEAMQPINSVENNIIFLSLIVSLLLLGIVAAISTNITAPIRRLQVETEKIFNGEYGHIINLKFKDEIGDLIEAFNKMSVKLKEQKDRLEYEQVIRTSYVIDAQEAERQRLSRELHDGLAQYVLAIKLKLEYALSFKGTKQMEILEEVKNLFTETIQEIRNISNNLMPSILNEYGIIKAIENLAENTNQVTKLNFLFNTNIKDTYIPKKIQIYLFRIIQEALNNTIKHSEAKNFIVNLFQVEKNIVVEIKDDGKGCKFEENTKLNGNGLANIKERINLLSGNIEINSVPLSGFSIKIIIPL